MQASEHSPGELRTAVTLDGRQHWGRGVWTKCAGQGLATVSTLTPHQAPSCPPASSERPCCASPAGPGMGDESWRRISAPSCCWCRTRATPRREQSLGNPVWSPDLTPPLRFSPCPTPHPHPCQLRGGLGHWRPHWSELTRHMPVPLRHYMRSNHSLQKKEACGRKCLVHTHGGQTLLVVTRQPGPQEQRLTTACLPNYQRTQDDYTGSWLRT